VGGIRAKGHITTLVEGIRAKGQITTSHIYLTLILNILSN
jgi:hypothetical protein